MAAYFDQITDDVITIGRTETGATQSVAPLITALDVSLSMDGASEIQFEILDVDFVLAKNNMFLLRRNVFYRDQVFEIAATEVSPSPTDDPLIRIQARSKNIQLMKRDKKPESFREMTASMFGQMIADRFGMEYFAEKSEAVQTIIKASGNNNDESVWDVLSRLAGDLQYVLFETNNTLFFTGQENLLGKWGDPDYQTQNMQFIPLVWPEQDETRFPGSTNRWVLLEQPSIRKSDDDPMSAQGSVVLDRLNGKFVRPGMTLYLEGIPDFTDFYLVTNVSFSEGTVDPVRVDFRTPVPFQERPAVGGGFGGFGGLSGGGGGVPNSTLPSNIQTKIENYVVANLSNDSTVRQQLYRLQNGYATYVAGTTAQAITVASIIYFNTDSKAKTEIYGIVLGDRNKPASNNISYKTVAGAIQYVYSDLFANTSPAGANPPQRDYSFLYRKVDAAVNTVLSQTPGLPSSAGNALKTQMRKDALDIYLQTTYQNQVNRYNQYITTYGSTSTQGKILAALKNAVIYRNAVPSLGSFNFNQGVPQ